MEISQTELLALIGAKDVEIYLLNKRIAALEEALKNLPKPEEKVIE